MMEEDFYAVIKLVTGEEIFSSVTPTEEHERMFLILHNPVVIEIVAMKQIGMQGYKIDPWLKFADDDTFLLDMDRVITISEVTDEETLEMYQKFLDQYQSRNRDDGSKGMDREMGYISSVTEARKQFEKLYKSKDIKDS